MKSKLLEYGLILACFIVTLLFLRSNWVEEGIRTAESRLRDSVRVDTVKINPDTITVEKVRLVPKVTVVRDTVFGEVMPPTARLQYDFDSTVNEKLSIEVDSIKFDKSVKTRIGGTIRTYPKISLEDLRLYPSPITIRTQSRVQFYEKPTTADLYSFWTMGILSGHGIGLGLGYTQYGIGYKYNFDNTGEIFGVVQIRL